MFLADSRFCISIEKTPTVMRDDAEQNPTGQPVPNRATSVSWVQASVQPRRSRLRSVSAAKEYPSHLGTMSRSFPSDSKTSRLYCYRAGPYRASDQSPRQESKAVTVAGTSDFPNHPYPATRRKPPPGRWRTEKMAGLAPSA